MPKVLAVPVTADDLANTLAERLAGAVQRKPEQSRQFKALVRKTVRDVMERATFREHLDPAVARLIEPLNAVVAAKRTELSERNMELLVEAMLPAADPMSAARSKIEADNAQARVKFLEEVACLTSTDLAEMAGHNARNRSVTASRWKGERKVFSVRVGGKEWFPAFQFRDGKPLPVIAQALATLPLTMSPWQIAFWFVSSNAWLDGEAPATNLDSPERVLEAARRLGEEAAG